MALGRGRRSRHSTRQRGLSPLEVEVWSIWNGIKAGAPAYRRQRRDWALRWARHAASLRQDLRRRATTMRGERGNCVGKAHVETFWELPEIVRLSDSTRLAMWRAIADTWAAAGMAREPPRPPVLAQPTQDSVVTS
jgi:hypothetical protein